VLSPRLQLRVGIGAQFFTGQDESPFLLCRVLRPPGDFNSTAVPDGGLEEQAAQRIWLLV